MFDAELLIVQIYDVYVNPCLPFAYLLSNICNNGFLDWK